MSFPAPSLPAPALTPYQFSYRGVAFGGIVQGNPYQVQRIGQGGLDMAAIIAGDAQRSLQDGELAGVDLVQGRDIPIDLLVINDGTSLDHARQQLGAVFQSAGNTEYPLWMSLPSGTFACMARPRKYNFQVDSSMLVSGGVVVNTMLHATDPRWYAAPSKTLTGGLSISGASGFTWPLTWPATLGAGAINTLTVWNLGYTFCFPQLVFTGPLTNPWAMNGSIPGNPKLTFAITLNAGDTLTVDTDFQTMVLTTAGATIGAPRDNVEVAGSTWWTLQPANGPNGIGTANSIQWGSADTSPTTGTLTVNSGDAYGAL